jgi:predicted aconitase with swiveling domain
VGSNSANGVEEGTRYKEWSPVQGRYVALRIEGLSQAKASKEVGVDPNTGWKWEQDSALRMKQAIEAGRVVVESSSGGSIAGDDLINVAAEATRANVRSVVSEATQFAVVPAVLSLLSEYKATQKAVETLVGLLDARSEEVRRRAALDILDLTGTRQAIKTSMTESTSEEVVVRKGLSEDGRAIIEQHLLGVRNEIWKGMSLPNKESDVVEVEVTEE